MGFNPRFARIPLTDCITHHHTAHAPPAGVAGLSYLFWMGAALPPPDVGAAPFSSPEL